VQVIGDAKATFTSPYLFSFPYYSHTTMVHPAIVAAIIGAAVVAGVVTYYYIDEHYHNEYEYVQTSRYEHYSDSDSDDEEQGFNARRLLQKAGLRRRRRQRDNDMQNESFSMVCGSLI
jgi:hypothetical protein